MAITEPVLLVDDDPFVLGLLSHVAEGRGVRVTAVTSAESAESAAAAQAFGVAVIDLRLGTASGLELVRRLRTRDPDIETIVISADRRLSSALESFEHEIFAFLPKPLDPAHVLATVERAAEHRRDTLERRRLTWELALLNEVAELLASTLDIDAVFGRAIERVSAAFDGRWAFIRVRPAFGGPPAAVAAVGLDVSRVDEIYRTAAMPLTSDGVFATGRATRINADERPAIVSGVANEPAWRAAISVPIATGHDLIGVLTLVADTRRAFTDDDERLLVTIGRQFGVAVSNAHLYQRVHRAKSEWERTFDAISDPIAVFGADRRSLRMNAALAALHGWAITDTQGRTCAETGLCGGDRPDCLVARALGDGQPHRAEIVTGDGRIFAVTTLPVPGASAAVLFAKEVTEERAQARRLAALGAELSAANAQLTEAIGRLQATQAQLVQSEKLSAIGQLVAGVAHELNNPLTSIIGYTQLVQEALAHPGDAPLDRAALGDDVGRVLSEADRAARIVRNLLTFARRQTSSRVATDLAELCRRVLELRRYDHQVRHVDVALTVDGPVPPAFVDDNQMQQALLNLVLNAEQAMRTTSHPRLAVSVSVEPHAGAVLIAITDNGHGIEAEHLPRVFDPFFTTRDVGEGTGLGLSIVYGIVRDHGGQIWAESAHGRTTFFVRVPVRMSDGAEPVRALVAHTEQSSRDYFVAALAGWGCSVRAAATVHDTVTQIARGDIELVLLDPAMIERNLAEFRQEWAALPAPPRMIAIDPPSVSADAGQFLRETAAFVLPPPFDLPHLRAATLAALRRPI